MSLDRFVRWEGEGPTREELELVLEDYIGESGVVRWDERSGRFWISFATHAPGHGLAAHSDAYRRAGLVTGVVKQAAMLRYHEGARSIEVYVDRDHVDVITRMADDFTNGVAARLAEVLGRLFGGRVEAG